MKRITSHIAFRRSRPLHNERLAAIRALIERQPVADWEIASILNMPYTSVQSVRGQLVDASVIVDSGTRHDTPYGRPAIVWAPRATEVE